ncbi:MAG: ATP synthase F1 subunit delta [Elusimicrobia bacterium]|nr:ATP synthase F1 subunit delta [Elusimicrobiota bacterium]
MKATDRVLAWRYAKALFLAACAKGVEGRVQSDLQGSHGALLDILPALRHPLTPALEKKRRIRQALERKVGDMALSFLELLVDKKRFELLPLIASDLGKLIAEKNNEAKAHVRAARALSAQDQERLKSALRKFTGKNIELEIKEDPEIIGGVVVRLGDWVLDSSFRGQLRSLREALYVH